MGQMRFPTKKPVSKFHFSFSGTRNLWTKTNDFITDIGEWIEDNKEAISNNGSIGLYFLAWGGLIIGVIGQWISSGFFSALLTAVIGGIIVYYAALFIAVAFMFVLQIFFWILRYIFYNIYTLLITILLVVGLCFSDQIYISKDKNRNTVVLPTTILQPNYYCDVNTTLKVREYPRTNAKEIGLLKRHEEVYVYSIDRNFAKIDFKGRIAYASTDYLKPKGGHTSINSSTQSTNRNKTTETPSKVSTSNMSATINRIWEEHNVFQDQQKGMKIHVKFNTYNMLNVQGKCIAYFYYNNGAALKDNNNSYRSPDGQVIVEQNFKPGYKETSYEDFVLFIPYNELHLPSEGKTNLKAHVVLQVSPTTAQPKKLTTSDWIYFWYGKSE